VRRAVAALLAALILLSSEVVAAASVPQPDGVRSTVNETLIVLDGGES